ncbi:TRAP transporter small permease [Alteribacillus sp. JSM 102045]|uniref:TRAP transporter small permease n=1 Tax=Alteribacillus sp. JSM 102045 TaxID=1562101 RepID=UPI0035C0A551
MVQKLDQWFYRSNRVLTKMVEIVCMMSVGAIAIITILAFISRYILQQPLVGTDELALFLLMWITFLGASLSIRRNDMVALSLFKDKLNSKNNLILQMILQSIIFCFSILGFWVGWLWLTSSSIWEAASASLEFPLWIPSAIFPFTMLIMAIFTLENILNHMKRLKKINNEGEEGEVL